MFSLSLSLSLFRTRAQHPGKDAHEGRRLRQGKSAGTPV